MKCEGTTRAGKRCSRPAKADERFCAQHRPADEEPLTVAAAVQRDLADLAARDPRLSRSALAASALALAESIDHPKTSATARSMCARSLIDTLDRLLELAPAAKENDDLDDLRAKRAARRARSAATAN